MTAIQAVLAASLEAARKRAAAQSAEAAQQPAEADQTAQSAKAAQLPSEVDPTAQSADAEDEPADIVGIPSAHSDDADDDIELSGHSSFRPDPNEMGIDEDDDDMETESVYTGGNFSEVFATSVASPIAAIANQFKELMWDNEPITVQDPAPAEQIQAILKCLHDIEPTLPSTQVTRQTSRKFPQLMKVLNNHSVSIDHHIQFFKKPVVDKCDCIACKKGLFAPLIMPGSHVMMTKDS
eukprot:jgi/Tetstr1/447453/TSEL_003711.t1